MAQQSSTSTSTSTSSSPITLEGLSAKHNRMNADAGVDNADAVVDKSMNLAANKSNGDGSDDSNPYKIAAETRTINKANIICEDVVIGPNGFVSIKSISSIEDIDTKTIILNKDDEGNKTNTPLTLDTLKTQLNITVGKPETGKGGSKRSRKAKRTKKGGKKRRNTQRHHRKSR